MLLTDWITIGTSGPTIDGREISADDLVKMAKNYDPAVYTAVVNINHYYGNLGTVRALRTAPGVNRQTALQAQISPNQYFLQQNAESLRLFSSMEITRNFIGTGEPYLTGVATTDTPASIGTTELHFSKTNSAGAEYAAAIELPENICKNCREESGVIQDFFNRLGEYFTSGKNQHKDQDEMTKEDVQSIVNEAMKPVTEKLSSLLESLEKNSKQDTAKPPAGAGKTETATPPATEQGFDFAAAFKTLNENVTAVTEKLAKALGEKTGTEFNAGTGAAGNDAKFI